MSQKFIKIVSFIVAVVTILAMVALTVAPFF